MKFYSLIIVLMLALVSCKNDKTPVENKVEATVLEKIATRYGIENWNNVNSVSFSFVVNPGEKEFVRRWMFQPKLNRVTFFENEKETSYIRDEISEDLVRTDMGFVNDWFWLSFPFHLVWDDITYEELGFQETPIRGLGATKIRISYPKEGGGYTPGDAYEIYIDDEYNILEWTYHPKGQVEPALVNTFEEQQEIQGIRVDMFHGNRGTGFQLNFRDVVIE